VGFARELARVRISVMSPCFLAISRFPFNPWNDLVLALHCVSSSEYIVRYTVRLHSSFLNSLTWQHGDVQLSRYIPSANRMN
jgi:hypothetical protein